MLRCVVNVASLVDEGNNEDVRALVKYNVDWQTVGIGLGKEVESGVALSHGLDCPLAMVGAGFLEGGGIKGVDVEKGRLKVEWAKLRRIAEGEF